MLNSNIEKRTSLAIKLLYNLKDLYKEMSLISGSIEGYSDVFLNNLYSESKPDILDQTEKYKSNIEEIKKLNRDITSKINNWYEFAKDTDKMKCITFPLQFYLRKRTLNKSIKKINQTISEIVIENRFIKEQLLIWEQELKLKAVQQLKQGDEYLKFQELLNVRNDLIEHLKYLLPTIPGLCPVSLNPNMLDGLIEKLSKLAA